MEKHIYDFPYMDALSFYKCLSDDTRLKAILLIQQHSELCVCELVEALTLSQPKVSRHLALLRDCGLLQTARRGQWVFYSISSNLPSWCRDVLGQTLASNNDYLIEANAALAAMSDRPACE